MDGVTCSQCQKGVTYEVREALNKVEDIILVFCKSCRLLIYARRENKIYEIKWKAQSC